jgi:hypothetical protein
LVATIADGAVTADREPGGKRHPAGKTGADRSAIAGATCDAAESPRGAQAMTAATGPTSRHRIVDLMDAPSGMG